MIRAQIQRNNHSTNKKLLDLRQLELEYYAEFFDNFATISALLIGFTLNSVTNMVLDGSEKQSRVRVFADLYWVSCGAVFATAIYTLFSTMLCNVFGPGLGLRGPVGSMVRAVNGMFEEQHAILYSFVLSIVAFAIMMVAYFWITMTTLGAAVGTTIVFLSSFVWYHYCVRIVNRFQWNESAISWHKADMPDALYTRGNSKSATGSSTMIQRDAGNGEHDYFTNIARNTRTIGYLSRKSSNSWGFFSRQWRRLFYVLSDSELFCYESKKDFEESPHLPLLDIPLDVRKFRVTEPSDFHDPLCFVLEPVSDALRDLEPWVFRCDTLQEVEDWTAWFHSACSAGQQ